MPRAAGGGWVRWEEAGSGSRQRAGMRSSACTALGCNVNYPHPRAPGEARLAPACPHIHSSTQVAALGGTVTSLPGARAAPARPCRAPERQALAPQQRPSAQPCPAGRGNAWAALLLFWAGGSPGQGCFPLLPQPSRGTCSAPGALLPCPRYSSCAPAEAVATQGLPMLWEQSRPPAAHCQQHPLQQRKPTRAPADLHSLSTRLSWTPYLVCSQRQERVL